MFYIKTALTEELWPFPDPGKMEVGLAGGLALEKQWHGCALQAAARKDSAAQWLFEKTLLEEQEYSHRFSRWLTGMYLWLICLYCKISESGRKLEILVFFSIFFFSTGPENL